jgi:hypothetical protein
MPDSMHVAPIARTPAARGRLKRPSCLVFKIEVRVQPKSLWVFYFFSSNVLVMCLLIPIVCELSDPYEKALINNLWWHAMMNYNLFLLIFYFNLYIDLNSMLLSGHKGILSNLFLILHQSLVNCARHLRVNR